MFDNLHLSSNYKQEVHVAITNRTAHRRLQWSASIKVPAN